MTPLIIGLTTQHYAIIDRAEDGAPETITLPDGERRAWPAVAEAQPLLWLGEELRAMEAPVVAWEALARELGAPRLLDLRGAVEGP